ncbi:hypothetical protein LAG90_13205 [Marinilongibacter aquaticus]|uniref:hypothetical protein n=1 Tax=Marinilongibacter aquaticus TaxID=2975157 RepID=UPI0021BDD652|nr:hypothetical protein [Marinilongibacter aquaticus]UBM57770.1 hypothetical protein LAG90_13205 [Marinilongibacter aquaticus]
MALTLLILSLFSCKEETVESDLLVGCSIGPIQKNLDFTRQFVAIPDSVFEKQLISQSFDSDNTVNGKIAMSDARKIKSLTLNSQNFFTPGFTISSLDGIEYFSELEELRITDILEDTLDLTYNTKLIKFSYYGYSGVGGRLYNRQYKTLEKLYFGKNSKLQEINIGLVWLEELDLSGLQNLNDLLVYSEPLNTVYFINKEQKEKFSQDDAITKFYSPIEYKICRN